MKFIEITDLALPNSPDVRGQTYRVTAQRSDLKISSTVPGKFTRERCINTIGMKYRVVRSLQEACACF